MSPHSSLAYDRDLIGRDTLLPGLATVLDPEVFTTALQTALPESTLTDPRITYLRYKPHTNCLVTYQFRVDGEIRTVYATAYRKADESKLHKALVKFRGEGRLPPVVLPQEIIVRNFPTDRRLKTLNKVADDGQRAALLESLLPQRPELWDARLNILRYKPERRMVAQLVTEQGPQAILKLYNQGDFDRAYRGAKAFRATPGLQVASLMGVSKSNRLLISEWISGRPFDLVLKQNDTCALSGRVGVALAELHMQEPQRLKTLSREEEVQPLFSAAEAIAFLLPKLASRTQRLASALASELMDAPQESRPVHGDFSADQVLLADNGAAIIDFDGAVRGDPAWDLGTFAAQLEHDVLTGGLSKIKAEEVMSPLLDGYRNIHQRTPTRVALYTAAGLLRLAPHPFRTRGADWPEQTEALLAQAEALLKRRTAKCATMARGQVRVTDRCGTFADSALDLAERTLEPEIITPLLLEELRVHGLGDAELRDIQVIRHKAGRRCLIAYDFDTPMAPLRVLGKVRVKGTDYRTHRLQETLWNGGFDSESSDGVSVAQPLGVLERFHMTLQRAVPGVSAHMLLENATGTLAVSIARRVAEAAHKLHQASIPSERTHSAQDELAILQKQLAGVIEARPDFAQRLTQLWEGCRMLAEALPEPRSAGIHRDFYSEQIIVNNGRLYLLDLDLYALGDPALDIGNFMGHLTEQALRTFGDAEALRPQEEALVSHYCELSGVCHEIIRIYSTLTLARHIAISQRIPERNYLTETLLVLSETRLERDLINFGAAATR